MRGCAMRARVGEHGRGYVRAWVCLHTGDPAALTRRHFAHLSILLFAIDILRPVAAPRRDAPHDELDRR